MALVLLHHPLVMCTTLLFVLACRRALRACVTRQLWIHVPSAPKALLELHSSVLGAAVVAVIALGAGLVLLLGQPLSAGGSGLLQGACSASLTQSSTERQWWANWQPPWSAVSLASDAVAAGAAASPLAAAPADVPSLASLGRSSLAAFAALWPHPILVGLLVQSLLPLLVHPALVPRFLEALAQQGRRAIGLGGLRVRGAGREAAFSPNKRWPTGERIPSIRASWRHSLLRKAFRVGYGAVLLLSVLWSLPLVFELSVVWWQEEVLLHLDQDQDGIITLHELLSPARAAVADALCGSNEKLRAERAAATLRTLAFFGMLRRVLKALDLQVGHYYGGLGSFARREEWPSRSPNGWRSGPSARATASRYLARAAGAAGAAGGGGSDELELSTTESDEVAVVGVPRWRRGLRSLLPRWLRGYLRAHLRSLRWFAVTPPTYVFWHVLSLEMASSSGWRRLLLPALFFAVQEVGHNVRLLALMLVHEGIALHERLRGRSAFWLHRLELGAALHWVTLALALAFDASSVFGAPPPPVGVLLHLPAACLVCVTVLEQLPGDESEIAVLLRAAARVSAPGDLRHMCSNSWYRGLLDILVQAPESLVGFVDLARAQRSLPWWLRPPLPDAADLRASSLPPNTLGGLSISDVLNGDGSVRAARVRSGTFGLQYSALPSSGSLADLAGSALLKVASLTALADLAVPGLTRRGSMEGLLAVSQPLRRCSTMHPCTQPPMHPCTHAPSHPYTHAPMHPATHTPMHPCTHAPMRQCTHAPMHPCTHAPMHPCANAPMRPCTHAPMHPCANAPMHPCTHAPMHQRVGAAAGLPPRRAGTRARRRVRRLPCGGLRPRRQADGRASDPRGASG